MYSTAWWKTSKQTNDKKRRDWTIPRLLPSRPLKSVSKGSKSWEEKKHQREGTEAEYHRTSSQEAFLILLIWKLLSVHLIHRGRDEGDGENFAFKKFLKYVEFMSVLWRTKVYLISLVLICSVGFTSCSVRAPDFFSLFFILSLR